MFIHSNYLKADNKKNIISAILIVDGDNTLWDTNAVFETAQLNMLRCLDRECLNIDPKREFSTLREFDDILVEHYKKHEYDFSVLALALYLFFKGAKREEAISRARKAFENKLYIERIDLAIKCNNIFKKDLEKFPPLFKNVKETLNVLKQYGCIIILSSEGDKERVRRIIKHYSLEEDFDYIVNERKSVEQFKEAKNIGTRIWRSRNTGIETIPEIMVIGDLLDRDIRFGNQIGAITIHKRGGYKSHQISRDKDEIPNYEIKEMCEIIDILSEIEKKPSNVPDS